MSKEAVATIAITAVLGLLGLAVMAGQNFTPSWWSLGFFFAAAVVAVIGWLVFNRRDVQSDDTLGNIEPPKESARAKPDFVALKCTRIDFVVDWMEITVVAFVDWVQNKSANPVRVHVKLVVPFGITLFSAGASQAPVQGVSGQLLQPQIYLQPRDGAGPGYWTFSFTRKYLTGFGSPYPNATDDEIFERLRESEMYFELRDLSSDERVRIDAPGTLQKRVKRGGGTTRRN